MVSIGRRAQSSSTLGAFALLVVPLLAGVALAVWALAQSPLESASAVQPVVAEVGSAERDHAISTTATLHRAPEVEVTSQSSGTVTSLSLESGQRVGQGDVAYEVDGLPVVAYVADAPLFRDITAGLRGDDVDTARQLLVDLDYLDAADRPDSAATGVAIRAFNDDHGHGDDGMTLAVGSLLWVPAGSDAPSAVTVQVGDLVAPHEPLYTTTAGSASVSVEAAESEVDRTVTLGTSTVTLPAGQTVVDEPDDVAELEMMFGDQESAPAMVADLVPTQVGTVPASAVVVDMSGGGCYFTGVDDDPVPIEVADGGLGLVDVDPERVGTPVLVNPRSTRDDLSCAS